MSRWNLLIVDGQLSPEPGAGVSAAEWAVRLNRHADSNGTLRTHQRLADRIGENDLALADAVLLLLPAESDQTVPALPPTVLNQIEERAIPLVVLGVKPSEAKVWHHSSAMLLPSTIDPQALLFAFRGMLHRQPDFCQLRQELALAQRFHGGLENEVSRMHDELQLAAIVQRELLPREIPTLHGIRFATLWRPANYVSGDIYDLTRLDEDHIGVFIADAVGHGVPAALMTMVISRSLLMKEISGQSYRIVPPAEVMNRLNQELIVRQEKSARFATAVYAVVNCRTRIMTLAGAGHPPPIHLSETGPPRQLETNGGLLGIFEDEVYDQIDVELSVNDRVIFFSDGFEQAFPDESADAYERQLPTLQYRQEFEDLARKSDPEQMVDHLRQRLDSQRGSLHQTDDLTMICMIADALRTIRPEEDVTQNPASPRRVAS